MKEYKTKSVYGMSFTSINEVKDYIANTKIIGSFRSSETISETKTKFTKTTSLDDALGLMQNGYIEGLKGLQAKTIKRVQTASKTANKLVSSQIGVTPNVGAFVTGNPLNMFNIKQIQYKNTKIINLFLNCAVHSGISASDMEQSARKLFEYIQALENKGYRINLHMGCIGYFKKSKNTLVLDIKLKDAGEHFDALRTAFPLLHPSFLRRICFAIIERQTGAVNDGGYGVVKTFEENKATLKTILPNYIYTEFNCDFEKALKGL